MTNLIIDVRINEYTLRKDNPNVPYSPEEIANQALECSREGASILHYHARDPQTGAPSSDVKLYGIGEQSCVNFGRSMGAEEAGT